MSVPEFYSSNSTTPAYSLRWSWSGWPSQGEFPTISDDDWNVLAKAWEPDGIRLLERSCKPDLWQATVSTKPGVGPSFIVARLKGRLDHHFRSQMIAFKSSRKVALRSVDNNTAADVQEYIRNQENAARFCDPGFAETLQQFT